MSIMVRRRQAQRAQRQIAREGQRRKPGKPALSALSLPEDVLGNEIRLTLLGAGRMLVENHAAILEVGQSCIRVLGRHGVLRVEGEGLVLRDVRPLSLAIEGKIARLTVCE